MILQFDATLMMDINHNIIESAVGDHLKGDREIEVRVTADYEPFVPAKTNALPEDCYDASGGGHEITEILEDASGDGDWQPVDFGDLPKGVETYLTTCIDDELTERANQ